MKTLILALSLMQDPCPNLGAHFVPGSVDHGPKLGCKFAVDAPSWQLLEPPHHEGVPRDGFTRVAWREMPRIFVRFECTGLWFFPVRPVEVKTLGYVTDVTARRCR